MSNIDFTYLDVLSEDDDDFKTEFIETFEGTYVELVRKMKDNLNKGDLDQLSKAAHQLKPSAKMISLPCADTLEDLQYHPDKANDKVLKEIEDECDDALKQLKDWAAK